MYTQICVILNKNDFFILSRFVNISTHQVFSVNNFEEPRGNLRRKHLGRSINFHEEFVDKKISKSMNWPVHVIPEIRYNGPVIKLLVI